MQPIVIANWKMNPSSPREAERSLEGYRALFPLRGVAVFIAPPAPYLSLARRILPRARIAAQDIFWEKRGAYTGAISPLMVKGLGATSVLIGHSERRALGDTNEIVAKKLQAALSSGLVPVLIVGEGLDQSQEVVPRQIRDELISALKGIHRAKLSRLIVAYEPLWAVGTGKADTPDNATRRAIYIRKILATLLGRRLAEKVPVLYGGSVTPKNAAGFLVSDVRGMDGLLVGGASLDAKAFAAIVRSVRR